MVAQGSFDKDIARELGIAYATVRIHIAALASKLEIAPRTNTRVLIARWWYSKTPDTPA